MEHSLQQQDSINLKVREDHMAAERAMREIARLQMSHYDRGMQIAIEACYRWLKLHTQVGLCYLDDMVITVSRQCGIDCNWLRDHISERDQIVVDGVVSTTIEEYCGGLTNGQEEKI